MIYDICVNYRSRFLKNPVHQETFVVEADSREDAKAIAEDARQGCYGGHYDSIEYTICGPYEEKEE